MQIPDGYLPLVECERREPLEHLMFDDDRFVRVSGSWVFIPMTGDRSVDVFIEIGRELQAAVDAGDFDEVKDPEQFAAWKKMTEKFHDTAF